MLQWRSSFLLGLCLTGALACSTNHSPPTSTPHGEKIHTGKSSFETAINGNGGARGGETASDGAAGGAQSAAPGATNTPTSGSTSQPRTIEESDIYKQVGNTLYVLNHYRGLEVIDLSDLDNPKLIGRAPIFGYPHDLYVRGTNAYVIVSDYYTYWRAGIDDIGIGGVDSFHGSQVRVIDISDPTNPTFTGGINVDGDVTDSRIVGDIMYLVSTHYGWWDNPYSTDNSTKTVVLSVDVSDPAKVHAVESKDFPQGGWDQHISVTPNTVYVSTPNWDNSTNGYSTTIQYVDISAPTGHIVVRGSALVPGTVQNRWAMDEYNSVLRVASGQQWGNGDVYLTLWSVKDPDNLTEVGSATLTVSEALTAARFDGPHGYLVSSRNWDPLFAFDLTDPTSPVLLGSLQMSGWLDFLVPQGDRIVALGHDQQPLPNGGTSENLAVSLIDVTPGQTPQLLKRVAVGADWGWVPSSADDFAKVFKVLPDANLVMLPFQSWSATDWRYVGGVQLIDYTHDNLVSRGLIKNAGWVERGIPENPTTVLTLSDEVFQIMDITDRDNPSVRGRLELSRNVQDFALLPNGYAVQLSGDWNSGDTSITITKANDPDSATPVAEVHVPAPYGRMFVSGSMAYVVSIRYDNNGGNSTTWVQVVDLSDPTHPKLRGSTTLPQPVWPGYHSWYWDTGDETVLLNGNTLAFHQYTYYRWYDCDGCDGGGRPPNTPAHTIYLVDLSNPDAPSLASTTPLNDASWAWGMRASGSTLYLSTYHAVQRNNQYYATYYLNRIDATDPHNPKVLAPVNIPGEAIGFDKTGDFVYTLENTWDYGNNQNHTYLHVLAIVDNVAYEQGFAEVKGWINNVQLVGSTAFVGTEWGEETTVMNQQQWVNHTQLIGVDLSNIWNPSVVSTTEIPAPYGYLQKVDGGRAFFGVDQGLLTYDVTNAAKPQFDAFYRTQGWSTDLLLDGNTLYVPSGEYGVQIIALQ